MSDTPTSTPASASSTPEDRQGAMFVHLVLQQASMAAMCLGQVPHPDTGQKATDLEGARFFIDQLEMLACKTKGNLSPQEEQVVNQNLTTLRLAFVEAARQTGSAPAQTPPSPAPDGATAAAGPSAESGEESHKRFTKKYG